MTIATTKASRRPMAKATRAMIEIGGEAEVVEELVRLLVGGLAVVAGDLDGDVGGDQLPCRPSTRCRMASATVTAFEPARLAMASVTEGTRCGVPSASATVETSASPLSVAKTDVGDVAHVDRPVVAGGDQQVADLLGAAQGLAGDQRDLLAIVADPAGREGRVGAGDLGGELLQRHAVKRQPLGVGGDADHLVGLADQVGQADVLDLGDLGAQLAGDAGQVVRGDAVGGVGLRREGERQDRHVVDAAADDQRLRHPDRDAVHVGAQLFVHPQDRGVGRGADKEARGHHHLVVLGLRIDVLDPVDAFDDCLERLGDQLDGVLGPQPVGAHVDVDHRHRDLRLLLARQRDQRHDAEDDGRQQEQRR